MKVALLHEKVTAPVQHFYWSGWLNAFRGFELVTGYANPESYLSLDGQVDVVFVSPGFMNLNRDCAWRKAKGRTKYVLLLDEDMHLSLESIRCAAEYYDLVCMFSEFNCAYLKLIWKANVYHMLPAVDPTIYHPIEMPMRNDVTFLGNYDIVYKIQESTRMEYLHEIKATYGDTSFIWPRNAPRGFYADEANVLYNDSKVCLDLPVMSVVGPRFYQAGASNSTVLLPTSQWYSRAFRDAFSEGEDYHGFNGGIQGCIEKLDELHGNYELRQRTSKNLQRKLMRNHTFQNRVAQILDRLFSV